MRKKHPGKCAAKVWASHWNRPRLKTAPRTQRPRLACWPPESTGSRRGAERAAQPASGPEPAGASVSPPAAPAPHPLRLHGSPRTPSAIASPRPRAPSAHGATGLTRRRGSEARGGARGTKARGRRSGCPRPAPRELPAVTSPCCVRPATSRLVSGEGSATGPGAAGLLLLGKAPCPGARREGFLPPQFGPGAGLPPRPRSHRGVETLRLNSASQGTTAAWGILPGGYGWDTTRWHRNTPPGIWG